MCNRLVLTSEKYPMCTWERCETIFANFSNIESDYPNDFEEFDFEEFDFEFENEREKENLKQDNIVKMNDVNDNSYIETLILVNVISICCHITLFSRFARAVIEQNLNLAAIQM
jgi:uncharacterized Rmd1/YagE family protein